MYLLSETFLVGQLGPPVDVALLCGGIDGVYNNEIDRFGSTSGGHSIHTHHQRSLRCCDLEVSVPCIFWQ
jgi:hypothetical protein